MSLAPGTRLGSYEVIGPLGAGGIGEVYRARDTTLNRDVAIKVLPDLLGSDLNLYRSPAFSPDGRWLAYKSRESGGR